MNFKKFFDFANDLMFKRCLDSTDEVLISIFYDYLKWLNISEEKGNVERVKAIYVKNLLNSKPAKIYAVIDENILEISSVENLIKGAENEHITEIKSREYITQIKIYKKDRIEKIEFTGINTTYQGVVDLNANNRARIIFDNGDVFEFSNIDDANDNWRNKYTEMMLQFILQL